MRMLVRFIVVTSAYVLMATGFRRVRGGGDDRLGPRVLRSPPRCSGTRDGPPSGWAHSSRTPTPRIGTRRRRHCGGGNTIEAVVAAAILNRLPSFDPSPALGNAWVFVGVAVIVSTATSATVGVRCGALRRRNHGSFPGALFEWWSRRSGARRRTGHSHACDDLVVAA